MVYLMAWNQYVWTPKDQVPGQWGTATSLSTGSDTPVPGWHAHPVIWDCIRKLILNTDHLHNQPQCIEMQLKKPTSRCLDTAWWMHTPHPNSLQCATCWQLILLHKLVQTQEFAFLCPLQQYHVHLHHRYLPGFNWPGRRSIKRGCILI